MRYRAIGALMLRAMLTSLGLQKTMAIFTCIDAVMLTLVLLLVKERKFLSSKTEDKKIVWFDRTFLANSVF